MKTRKLLTWAFVLASLAVLLQLSNLARAQDNDDDQNQGEDPPARVGRLDYSQGSISFRPAGEDDWVTGVPNRPMVTGDDLWSDQDSRAEVHVGSTALRLGSRTGITFLALDDRNTQIRLAQGSLLVRVRHLDDEDAFEVDTPNIAFSLLQPGEYRIDVSEDGSQTVTTVWHGRGRVTGGGFSYTVVADQSATFRGDDQHLDYDLGQIPRSDDFDNWAFDRDEHEDRSDSANYVSREMTGYEDLDEYGSWTYEAGYGPCWRPRSVAYDWAPYRYGHWVYVGPWGWTWVEDEPWGFAPFHYGRWAYVSNSWFWVPGPVVVRPVWAPALVAFVGGANFSVGVGWFPLAPGEVYVPGYRVSRRYVNNVNITNTTVNVTKVTNVYNTVVINKTTNITYVNQRVNNGVTVVSRDTFVNARPVARNLVRADTRELASAPVTHVVQAEPVRTSVIGAGRPVNNRPPAAVVERKVVAVRTPPPPPRPIEQRQAEAGGRLHEQSLVRPAGPARPAQMEPGQHAAGPQQAGGRPAQPQMGERPSPQQQQQAGERPQQQQPAQQQQGGFRPFTRPGENPDGNANNDRPNGNNNDRPNTNSQVRQLPNTPPRTYEQQGSAQPENRNQQAPERNQPETRTAQPENREFRPPQQGGQPENRESRPVPESHPLVKPTPPERERTPQQEQQQQQKFQQWQEHRPSPPPPQHQAAPPKQESKPSPPPKSDNKKH